MAKISPLKSGAKNGNSSIMNYLGALETIESLSSQTSAQQAGGLVAKALGFAWFNYEGWRPGSWITNGPAGWSERYRSRNYVAIDPVRRLTRTTKRTTSWSHQALDCCRDQQTSSFLEESSKFGASSGINIPIFGGFGREAFLSFSDPSRDMSDPNLLNSPFLYVIADRLEAFFSASRDQLDSEVSLTSQELLCLIWTSEGKSMAETASIVGIRRRTVEFHLSNARHKLGTVTLTQTVAEAMRLGLIH